MSVLSKDIVNYSLKEGQNVLADRSSIERKQNGQLEAMLQECSAGRIYVSAFPNFATFKRFLTKIAWETEVWLAETPDHLIHFNGDRFLGPRDE